MSYILYTYSARKNNEKQREEKQPKRQSKLQMEERGRRSQIKEENNLKHLCSVHELYIPPSLLLVIDSNSQWFVREDDFFVVYPFVLCFVHPRKHYTQGDFVMQRRSHVAYNQGRRHLAALDLWKSKFRNGWCSNRVVDLAKIEDETRDEHRRDAVGTLISSAAVSDKENNIRVDKIRKI